MLQLRKKLRMFYETRMFTALFTRLHPEAEVSNSSTSTMPEIMRNANLMQQGNFIDVFSTLHVSGAYAHHQEH